MCISPIMLKNGLTVGCGKCLSCLAVRRNDWSARLQLHSEQYDYMPFFVCLTYSDDNLVYGSEQPILYKRDIQLFIKSLKDSFKTYNTNFSYFACGELGDSFGRPHYHVLLFGLDELHKLFENSVKAVEDRLSGIWKKGRVDVGIAGYDGIHYVTKYVVKDPLQWSDEQPPFVICSHGIGKNWLDSPEAKFIKSHSVDAFRSAMESCPEIDYSSLKSVNQSARDILQYLKPFIRKTTITLPSGFEVPMPRYYRKYIFGSFEHHLDNPFAYFNHVRSLYDSTSYYLNHHQYDEEHSSTYSYMFSQMREFKLKKQQTLKRKKVYESV